MPQLLFNKFNGGIPLIEPSKLADGYAQSAKQCDLRDGNLSPLDGLGLVRSLPIAGVRSIYKYGAEWFFFQDTGVSAVDSPLPNSDGQRVYITLPGKNPKVTRSDAALGGAEPYPNVLYDLAMPSPPQPLCSRTVEGDLTIPTSTTYVTTYVNTWGDEGPPSDASTVIQRGIGTTVNVNLGTPPSGDFALAYQRIYRANSGSGGTFLQYVDEVPLGAQYYDDVLENDSLGEVLPSETWVGPPGTDHDNGAMQGIMAYGNGVLAGYAGNMLCLCEPYLPHAWPFEYRYTLNNNIVGMVSTHSGLIVCTTGKPYVGNGVNPAAFSLEELDMPQSCVAADSIVDMGEYAIYASPDGLVKISTSGSGLLTKNMMSRAQWQAFNPETIKAFYRDGKYVAFCQGADQVRGFIFDAEASDKGLILLDTDISFTEGFTHTIQCGYSDREQGTLYLSDGAKLYEWGAGAPLEYEWLSGVSTLPQPTAFGVMRVDAVAYPIAVELIGDGLSLGTFSVQSYQPVRLPSGVLARDWSVKIAGAYSVRSVVLATFPSELKV